MTDPSLARGRASVPTHAGMPAPILPGDVLGPQPPARSSRRGRVVALLIFAVVAAAAVYVFVHPTQGSANATSTTGPNALAGAPVTVDPSLPSTASASPSAPAYPPGHSPLVPDTVPMPVGALPGWKQVFYDDFNGSKINSSKWYVYKGQPQGDPVAWFDPSHVSVHDGMLVISAYKEKTPNGTLYATGGVGSDFSQRYGDFQVRYRADAGWGISYALLLWPDDNSFPPEVDFAEDNGRGRTMTSATEHYAPSNTMIHNETHGDYSQWHTAEVIWSPGELQFLIDGKVWKTLKNSHVPSIKMKLALQMQTFACGRSWEMCTNSSTPAKVNLDINWVSIYTAD